MRTTQTVPEFGHIQDGTTWMGGPTHELQRQHIPGYMGHVHSLFAENVHGKNFARVTSECLNQRATVGIEVPKVQCSSCRNSGTTPATEKSSVSPIPARPNLSQRPRTCSIRCARLKKRSTAATTNNTSKYIDKSGSCRRVLRMSALLIECQ